jgi:hypothetical protein
MRFRLLSIFTLIFWIGGCKTSADQSDLDNIDNSDPFQAPRSQGELGVCVSFGFTGQLENNLYLRTGVSVDLSERYFLRSALIEKGELYNVTMDRFDVFDRYGAVPEAGYPFAEILHRKSLVDSGTQINTLKGLAAFDPNLSMEGTLLELASLGEGDNFRAKRRQYLASDLRFGIHREMVTIPVDAVSVKDPRKVPKVDSIPCFKDENQLPGESKELTPQEFSRGCLGFDLKDYSSPKLGEGNRYPPQVLQGIEQRLDDGKVVSFGAYVRPKRTSLWSVEPLRGYGETGDLIDPERYRTEPKGGHAILITGYISKEDFTNVNRHGEGYLQSLAFEELALLFDLNIKGIEERIFGSMFPFTDDFSRKGRLNDQAFLAERDLLIQKIWLLEKKSRKLRNQMANQEDFTNLKGFHSLMKKLGQAKGQLEKLEQEILSNRLSELEFSRQDFLSFFQAYQKLVPAKGGDAVEFPFEVKRLPESDDLVVTLRDNDLPIRSLRVPLRENLAKRLERRLETDLGKVLVNEGGLFLIRNSWGATDNNGVRGYHHMTYDYLLKHTDEIIW